MQSSVCWRVVATVTRYARIFDDNGGASVLEVILTLGILAMAGPFLYGQIKKASDSVRDMAVAQHIVDLRDVGLNFVRQHQDSWPDIAQIRLSPDELALISSDATAGFIDKYAVRGATVTDVYLGFDVGGELRANAIARQIGGDAAVVGADDVAYAPSWAVAAPDFMRGDLVYRISRDFSGEDKTKYLHRGTSGEDDLNVMQRDLNMGGNDVFDIGTVAASSVSAPSAAATFVNSSSLLAGSVYYSAGANVDGQNVSVGNLRVTGDVAGLRNIYADNLNGRGYTTSGRVITDRATIENSVNVSRDFVLKSDSVRTVSGFAGIQANSVVTSYLSAEDIVFFDNFGLTVSGELMMSTTAPLKIGAWTFPSLTPPRFKELTLARASVPAAPSRDEFAIITGAGWRAVPQKTVMP